jgi:hypothetical protein
LDAVAERSVRGSTDPEDKVTLRIRQCSKPLASIAILGALAACSGDLTGANRHPVQLSFTTNTATTASTNGVAADLRVGPAGDLVLTSVQLVFRKIELDKTGDAQCVPEAEDADDDNPHVDLECEDVSREPLLVTVPVDGEVHSGIVVPLAAGTYSELEAKLGPAGADKTAFNSANAQLVGNSVRVEGSYKGAPFVFTSPVRSRLEMEFDPPLVIDETTTNATISIDVGKWFLNSDGSVIDPTQVGEPGSTVRQQIENNIRRSFHAFEDDDEDGEDHHEGHHGNGDGSDD